MLRAELNGVPLSELWSYLSTLSTSPAVFKLSIASIFDFPRSWHEVGQIPAMLEKTPDNDPKIRQMKLRRERTGIFSNIYCSEKALKM